MFSNFFEAAKMNKIIIVIALLLVGILWNCEDKIVDNERQNEVCNKINQINKSSKQENKQFLH